MVGFFGFQICVRDKNLAGCWAADQRIPGNHLADEGEQFWRQRKLELASRVFLVFFGGAVCVFSDQRMENGGRI